MASFHIQGTRFEAALDPRAGDGFEVRSVPRPYRVEFPSGPLPGDTVAAEVAAARHPMLLADSRVASIYLDRVESLAAVPRHAFEAREENKNIAAVLEVVDFLDRNRATKSTMLYVVGGGITQDVAAFAACMFKRGMPWTFIPSTLLAQGDSAIGSKAALNHGHAKNQLGLFSAPRRVIMHPGFLRSLCESDLLSGMGEILRLHLTGGAEFLASFEREYAAAREGSQDAIRRLLVGALSVKRAVIEVDEFEVDLRRSLNYGHSFGHALESLVDYRIPHGVAVTLGMLVENEIAVRKKMFPARERDRIVKVARLLVPPLSRSEFLAAELGGILDLLRRDKKADGNALKLVVPESIGRIRFIDLELDGAAQSLIGDCVRTIADAL